jgi:probable HAF family extracellular repeat protein
MTDLGNLGLSSFAYAINSEGQVVGHSKIDDGTFHAFLWERGGPMVDLNTLVFPTSDIEVVDPFTINDRGEIAAAGFLPDGEERAVILIPNGDCDDVCEARFTVSQSHPGVSAKPSSTTRETVLNGETRDALITSPRNRLRYRYYRPTSAASPAH